nr:MAG TPA: hypothetical protein [Caudoviricetes sp.]DAL65386.1 MAG TPA_asm: hypothetical protein [Caudoviricetes sp.]
MVDTPNRVLGPRQRDTVDPRGPRHPRRPRRLPVHPVPRMWPPHVQP